MHRTASLNEESARYSQLEDNFFLPENLRLQSTKNKQGSEGIIDSSLNTELLNKINTFHKDSYALYTELLENNISRELARIILPTSIYTSMVWKMDLKNLLHFLRLRIDSHAQQEIQDYANAIAYFVSELCPWTWESFKKHKIETNEQ